MYKKNKILEQVSHFSHLRSDTSFLYNKDINKNTHQFHSICGNVKRILK